MVVSGGDHIRIFGGNYEVTLTEKKALTSCFDYSYKGDEAKHCR